MRIVLVILMGIHAIIHFFGFLKGFNVYELKALTQPISKLWGSVWSIAALFFVVSLVLLALKNQYWWTFGLIAIVVSQILILAFWQDAKFGSIANLIILLSIVPAFGRTNFNLKLANERILQRQKITTAVANKLEDLPAPIEKWLIHSGATTQKEINRIYVQQEVEMKLKPSQKGWYKAKADQYFTIHPPSFNWSVQFKMNPFMPIVGRDKYENGKGEMLIKLFSIFKIVDAQNNSKINQAALQRYLAEMIWFPTAAMSKYISWETISDTSAKAIMSYGGVTGSGIFYFNEAGAFTKFKAMRYKETDDDAELVEWVIEVKERQTINNVEVPTELTATWKLEEGDWTWLQLKATNIGYSVN